MPLNTIPLPYGLRDLKLTPYTDFTATTLAGSSIDLPNAQTFTFTETEDYEDLRGDDRLITSHGSGAQIDWELGAGGISLEAYTAMAGGTLNTTGTTPNQIKRFRKKTTDQRPFFKIEGQAISDSGGDVHGVVFRCRATGDLGGTFEDTKFFITEAKGIGFASNVPADLDYVYDFIQNETITAIP